MFSWIWGVSFYLGLVAVILVTCTRAVVRATTVGRRGPKTPSCEQCAYPIEGLSGWRCPECGCDLRQGGIITRAMEVRRRGTYTGAILALTVGCGIFGLVGYWLGTWAYWTWGGGPAGAFRSQIVTPLTPTSNAYSSVAVQFDYDHSTTTVANPITLTYQLELNDASEWELVFDTGTATATATDSSGAPFQLASIDVSRPTFDDFFSAAGLDVEDAMIAVEVSELLMSAKTLVRSPYQDPASLPYSAFIVGATQSRSTPITPSGSISTIDWEQVIYWTAIGLSATIWSAGLVWIILRRRRLLRLHAPRVAPAPAA